LVAVTALDCCAAAIRHEPLLTQTATYQHISAATSLRHEILIDMLTRTASKSGDFSHASNSLRISTAPRSQKIREQSSDKVVELKEHEEIAAKEAERLGLTSFDMWALGISIVIGGQYFAWNEGLHAGFGSLLIATFLTATGYLSLVLCIAELSSALPFAGKTYCFL
jgi:amino acid permease